jgi:hexosaminidase
LEKVYSFNPIPDEIIKYEEKSLILGGSCNGRAEKFINEDIFDYYIYPRLVAMSESLWGKNN